MDYIAYATYLDLFDGTVMLFSISVVGNAWITPRKMGIEVTRKMCIEVTKKMCIEVT